MISPFERMYAKPNTNTASRITDAVSARSTIDLSARHAFNERISIGIIPQRRLVPPRALHPDRNFAAWFCLPRLGSAPGSERAAVVST